MIPHNLKSNLTAKPPPAPGCRGNTEHGDSSTLQVGGISFGGPIIVHIPIPTLLQEVLIRRILVATHIAVDGEVAKAADWVGLFQRHCRPGVVGEDRDQQGWGEASPSRGTSVVRSSVFTDAWQRVA